MNPTNKILKNIRFLPLVLLLAACTEKIDIKLDQTYTRLVVDGAVTTDSVPYHITLTKTADYFYNDPSPKVIGATLTISDGTNTYPMTETQPGVSGIYQTQPGFIGKTDKKYTLTVELPEAISGKTLFSASCDLRPVSKLDSTRVVFHPDWGKAGFWEIKVYAMDPGNQTNFYMFNYYRNGKLESDSITKVTVSDDTYFNGSYVDGATAFYINNEDWNKLNPGDTIMVQMSGITKEYYNFVTQVQMAGLNIPFFSGPPANVEGNINNGGIGFFTAYSNSYAKTIINAK